MEWLLLADTVAKVENRTGPKILRKLIFRRPTAAKPRSADTMVRGRFCVKRCGPSRHRLRDASAVLEKFGSSPKKDFFNTIAAKRTDGPCSTAERALARLEDQHGEQDLVRELTLLDGLFLYSSSPRAPIRSLAPVP
jgi:hypothetical protein